MSRSVKKGPFVEESLMKKIENMNAANEKHVVKTWSRSSTIVPEMVTQSLFMMVENMFLFMFQQKWFLANLVNLPQQELSEVMLVQKL